MYRHTRRTRLQFESLERRQMLAGNVKVTPFDGGILSITGDANDNSFAIFSPSQGVIQILGLSTTDGTTTTNTTINSAPSKQWINVKSINIDLSGGSTDTSKGNDSVVLTNLTLNGTVQIRTGEGNDIIALGNFDNSANLVDASVNSTLGAVTIKGGLGIDLQDGDNTVVAKNLTVQGPAGLNFLIEAGGGDGGGTDTISLEYVTVPHAMSITDTDTATITANNLVVNNVSIALGIGNDQVTIANSTINQTLSIDLNFGNDILSLDHSTLATLNATTGPGADQITLNSVSSVTNPPAGSGLPSTIAPADISINAGAGNDAVNLTNVTARALTVLGGADDDTLTLDTVTAGAAAIGAGDGADVVNLNHLTAVSLAVNGGYGFDNIGLTNIAVAKAVNVDAGFGVDTVTIGTLSAKSLNVLLGAGNDTLILDTATVTALANFDGGDGVDLMTIKNLTAKTFQASLRNGNDSVGLLNLSTTDGAFVYGGNGQDAVIDMGGNVAVTLKSIESPQQLIADPLPTV